MDLDTIEALKAEAAAEALTDPRAAAARYAKLAKVYRRHEAWDGLLALQFNALLAALRVKNRRDSQRLITDLFDALEARASAPLSPIALEVVSRLRGLFQGPISGVEHRTTSALEALLNELDARPLPLR
ncbi:hypothetical protein KKB55_22575, partial [Myxococcota bacterium]|nr:hypothetical protein [Myxococcota bacterium]